MKQDYAPAQDDSGVRFPPPLYFAGGLALGLVLDRVAPLRHRLGRRRRAPAVLLISAGILLIVWALVTMRRADTSAEPWEPTTAIVTNGPFRYSRNPIYLGDAVTYLGAALLTRSLWPSLLLPAVLLALWLRVIRKEERYLERKFGEEYLAYKRRVRPWL